VQLWLKSEEAELGGVIVFASSGPMLQQYWLKVLAIFSGVNFQYAVYSFQNLLGSLLVKKGLLFIIVLLCSVDCSIKCIPVLLASYSKAPCVYSKLLNKV